MDEFEINAKVEYIKRFKIFNRQKSYEQSMDKKFNKTIRRRIIDGFYDLETRVIVKHVTMLKYYDLDFKKDRRLQMGQLEHQYQKMLNRYYNIYKEFVSGKREIEKQDACKLVMYKTNYDIANMVYHFL